MVVVGVVGVVEFDIDGPDPLGFAAACASDTAPMMMRLARQLVAKSLRVMIAFHSGYATQRALYVVHGGKRYLVRVPQLKTPCALRGFLGDFAQRDVLVRQAHTELLMMVDCGAFDQ